MTTMRLKWLVSAVTFASLPSGAAFAGFDINGVVTRSATYDQVDLYLLNRDTGGTYVNPFFATGTGFFGAFFQFRLRDEHRVYFGVNRTEFGDRVDFRNASDKPEKGWLRVGSASTTAFVDSNPSPNAFPFGMNPYEPGLSSFDAAWGYSGSLAGVIADQGLGAHAARLVVDPNTTIVMWGLIQGSDQQSVTINADKPFVISTVPEPMTLIAQGALVLLGMRRHRR